jgi:Flp pilus assembly secretin CpaC
LIGPHHTRHRAAVASLFRRAVAAMAVLAVAPVALLAQGDIRRVSLAAGRSLPIQTPTAVSRVTIANPEVADIVVIGERDVVINAKAAGETDVLMFGANFRQQLRVTVQPAADRPQIVLAVKVAEVRRDFLRQFGVSGVYRGADTRAGTNGFRSDQPFDPETGNITLPDSRFLSVLTSFGTNDLLALLEAEEQRGRARLLAEPNLMAANRDTASFLVGGEIPIPIAQPAQNGQAAVTIVYREFGIRLNFRPEILGDSLVNLQVRPEVSSLDFANALLLSGFRVPALRTRRINTTVDVPRDRSLVISGLFNEEREQVRTGIPFLMNIPLLGNLFSSTRWQNNENELVIIVTPTVIDNPLRPRASDLPPVRQDTTLPARDALEKRLPGAPAPTAPRPPR